MKDIERKKRVKKTEPAGDTVRRIVNILFTLAGIVLLFRLIFKLFGANPENVFVDTLYNITEPYVGIFQGIFSEVEWQSGVFEPATVIGMVVLFIVSWLIQSLFSRRTVRQEEYATTTDTRKTTNIKDTSDEEPSDQKRKMDKNEKPPE